MAYPHILGLLTLAILGLLPIRSYWNHFTSFEMVSSSVVMITSTLQLSSAGTPAPAGLRRTLHPGTARGVVISKILDKGP